ncbi:chorismate-binding protein [Catellatospora sp. NPDC049609]|uniref:chorismate-binding protein n=1 Tax=Catellatospora sp. NPDC049609 TaxID=3155505 RepID=UPI00341BBEEB
MARDIPGIPTTCRDHAWERSRMEWRQGDPGDPSALVEGFLARHGLAVRDLSAGSGGSAEHDVCGAALFVSAAGGAAMIGGAAGAGSPAPAVPDVVVVVYEHAATVRPPEPPGGAFDRSAGPWRLGPWRASWTPSRHAEAVQEVRAAIARGDVYQVNLVGHARAGYAGDPLPALRRVASLPGARYAGILRGDGWAIGCASPETLLEVRDGRAVTRPIKGTAPATADGREALLSSPKERAEHIMIVDLQRNDLSHVAVTGSVRVPELFAVRRWADLWQAESDVTALVRPGTGLAGLLRAVCPGGSVTGAPKLAALREIAALEPVGRGASMGALGWVGPTGIDLGLTIRTVVADGEDVHVWAGGGITIDSDPAAEVAEAAAKAAPVRAALHGLI